MNTKLISFAIIIAILTIAYRWHVDSIDASKREQIAKQEGEIAIYKSNDSAMTVENKRLKAIADSLVTSIHYSDTVIVTQKYSVKINDVKRLGTDASIEYLRNRIN